MTEKEHDIRGLKKAIKHLAGKRGRHTELITVYVADGYNLDKVTARLSDEQGTATNIKSHSTRKNVTTALTKILQHLKLFKRTPKNGLALFCGNVAEQEGQSDFLMESIVPPKPLNMNLYRCSQKFVLEPLQDMLEQRETYGIIVIERQHADVALLKGKRTEIVKSKDSLIPGKFRAGGQCLARDSKVLVKDKVQVPIGELQVGNWIQTYDFKENILKNARILDLWEKEVDQLITIKTNKGEISCSKDHLFFLEKPEELVEVPAKDLKIDDELLHINKEFKKEKAKITEIQTQTGKFKLVDISVKNKSFVANKHIVHNSAQRFERVIEGMAKDFYRKIGEIANKTFRDVKDLKGILIGGPGPTKEEFIEVGELGEDVKKKIIGVLDIGYTGEQGIDELIEKAKDIIAEAEITKERGLVNRFMEQLSKDTGLAAYGEGEVRHALNLGAAEVLLLSENIEKKRAHLKCTSCDHEEGQTIDDGPKLTCSVCGSVMEETKEEDLIEELTELAEQTGATAELISTETKEGQQISNLGGIAAILRFKPSS